MSNDQLKEMAVDVKETLHQLGLTHLMVAVRGRDISVYSEHRGDRENRCRFTNIGENYFSLCVADHTGKWEPTLLLDPLWSCWN